MNCRGEHRRFALANRTLKELLKEHATTRGGANVVEQNDRLHIFNPPLHHPPDSQMARKSGENTF
jgi:hypothetical protein